MDFQEYEPPMVVEGTADPATSYTCLLTITRPSTTDHDLLIAGRTDGQLTARRLHKAAARSVLAHLIQMQDEGRVRCEGEATVDSVFELTD